MTKVRVVFHRRRRGPFADSDGGVESLGETRSPVLGEWSDEADLPPIPDDWLQPGRSGVTLRKGFVR